MSARFVSLVFSVASLAIAAPPDVLAQRGGGGHAGGMGAGAMGGGFGGGMPSGVQRGGAAPDRGAGVSNSRGPEADSAPTDRGRKSPSDLLGQNSRLSDNLAKLLPEGTDVRSAASGFGNLGEFVAAVHVSNNLGISFADLKDRMMAGDSLGSAIQALRPGANAQLESRKARAQADHDLKRS
jgi:hypothetical protein